MHACDATGEKHSYCEVCIRVHLKDIIFERKGFRMTCMAGGCKACYPRENYEQILDADALDVRDRWATRDRLKDVKGLTGCIGCDYQYKLKPGATLFECRNLYCQKRWCLKCKESAVGHEGKTCAQVKKDKGKGKEQCGPDLPALRRRIEEARSEAVVRKCGGCGNIFVKDVGCNKMICGCGNVSCYACKAQKVTYNHFGQGTCPMWAPVSEMEGKDADKAEKKMREKIKKENPGVTDQDLQLEKMSKAVEKDDKKKEIQEKRVMLGMGWEPGMPIDDADDDLMRDIEMQMGGMGIGGGRFDDDGWQDFAGPPRPFRGGVDFGRPIDHIFRPPPLPMFHPLDHARRAPEWHIPPQDFGGRFGPQFGQAGPRNWQEAEQPRRLLPRDFGPRFGQAGPADWQEPEKPRRPAPQPRPAPPQPRAQDPHPRHHHRRGLNDAGGNQSSNAGSARANAAAAAIARNQQSRPGAGTWSDGQRVRRHARGLTPEQEEMLRRRGM